MVSTLRLTLLRGTYALIAVGLALMIGPLILDPPADLEHMRGVVWSLLSAVGLLAILGIRHPLRMLPLLLVELVWKSIWLVAIGLPGWSAGTLSAGEMQTWWDCVISVVLFLVVIPWGYLVEMYVRGRPDPWKATNPSGTADLVGRAMRISASGK